MFERHIFLGSIARVKNLNMMIVMSSALLKEDIFRGFQKNTIALLLIVRETSKVGILSYLL